MSDATRLFSGSFLFPACRLRLPTWRASRHRISSYDVSAPRSFSQPPAACGRIPPSVSRYSSECQGASRSSPAPFQPFLQDGFIPQHFRLLNMTAVGFIALSLSHFLVLEFRPRSYARSGHKNEGRFVPRHMPSAYRHIGPVPGKLPVFF